MAVDPWVVLEDEQRLQWLFTPLKGVGPLDFGMTREEVKAAVVGVLCASLMTTDGWLSRDHPLTGPWKTNANVYFNDSGRLACIAIDALRGPQVRFDGPMLVGQVPSQLDAQLEDYLVERDMDLRFSSEANVGSEALGLVLRVQRAGDFLLSRPVMVSQEWAERCCDAAEGPIPKKEWHKH